MPLEIVGVAVAILVLAFLVAVAVGAFRRKK
jgi:hypothetical protein